MVESWPASCSCDLSHAARIRRRSAMSVLNRTEQQNEYTGQQDEVVPTPEDPGFTKAKGYSADAEPGIAVPDNGPIPLAEGPDATGAIRVPERESSLPPTGRKDQPGALFPQQ